MYPWTKRLGAGSTVFSERQPGRRESGEDAVKRTSESYTQVGLRPTEMMRHI